MGQLLRYVSLILIFSFSAWGEEVSVSDIDTMSIEELMNVKVSVASSRPKTISKSAGVVTLITSDDIAHMGARDLQDVLMMVPGFSFGTFQYGSVGVGFRGLWAVDGRASFIIDNQVMNETMFGAFPLARRLPLHLIDRIEIIRGPGSVKYGGTAEMAVIKITTKLAAQRNSTVSVAGGGQEMGSPTNQVEAMYFGKGEKVSGGVLGTYTRAAQGEGNITDAGGITFDTENASQLTEKFFESQLSVGNFSAQVMYERYLIRDQLSYGTSFSEPALSMFTTLATTLDYKIELSPHLTVRPYFNYRLEEPWQQTTAVANAEQVPYHRTVNHYEVGAEAHYDQNSDLNWLFGANTIKEKAKDNLGFVFVHSQDLSVEFEETAVFAEANYDLKWAELTAGVRHDIGEYGQATVPRLAFVKDSNKWGYKLLLSQAFRNPSGENLESREPGLDIVKAEKTTVAEFEINNKISTTSYISANFFYISLENPIIYYFETSASNPLGNNYRNENRVGSYGAELSYMFKNPKNSLKASFSYSEPETTINYWSVPGHKGEFLGIEKWKATLQNTFKFRDTVYITPTLAVIGPRYAYEYSTAAAALETKKYSETFLANIVFEKRDFLAKDLSFTLGVYNLLNTDYRIAEPFNGGSPSITSPSREYIAKFSKDF